MQISMHMYYIYIYIYIYIVKYITYNFTVKCNIYYPF